jgi:hypothetical protein
MQSMRFRTHTGLVAAAAVATMALGIGSARASLLNYDDFAYATGNVGGDTSPSPYSIPWASGTSDTVVTSSLSYPSSVGTPPADPASTYNGALSVPSGTTSPNRINIQNSGSSITSGSVYYSFLLSVNPSDPNLEPNTFTNPNGSTNNEGGLEGLIAGLVDAGAGNGALGTLDNGIYIRAGSTAGTVDIGIGGTRNHSTVGWSGDISASQPILVVGNYNIVTLGSSYTDNVYLDPTLGQGAPTANASSSAGSEDGGKHDGGVTSFFFTNDDDPTDGNTTPNYTVDELRVGTAYADVTPGTPAPEPASVALLGVSSLMLLRRKARS